MKITNLSKADRGIHDDRGRLKMLAPGQSIEISVSAKQEQLLRKKSCFKIQDGEQKVVIAGIKRDEIYKGESVKAALDKAPKTEVAPKIEEESLAQLRIDAESLGISVDKRWGEKRLQAEIDKVLSDAVHDTDSE